MARKPGGLIKAPFSSSSNRSTRKPQLKSKRKLDTSNAYTYLPSLPKRHRTSEATLSLSRDEAGASSSRDRYEEVDEEGEAMDERIRKVAMMIADEGPGEVRDGESDVDSDGAWNEEGSDEERFGHVFSAMQRKRKGEKVKAVPRKVGEVPSSATWYLWLHSQRGRLRLT